MPILGRFSKLILAWISHTFSEQIAALPIEIAFQVGKDSVHATRPRLLERQDHRALKHFSALGGNIRHDCVIVPFTNNARLGSDMDKKPKKSTKRSKQAISKKSRKSTATWFTTLVVGFGAGFSCQFFPGINDFIEETAIVKPMQLVTLKENSELPKAVPVLERDGYTVAYDGRTKTALWVYEELNRESCYGSYDREDCKFIADPDLPSTIQADTVDYRGSGFDRGHLAIASNHRATESEMQQTFYLSNISPQVPQFNRGYWKHLEHRVRDLTNEYSIVRVITGPLYLPHDEDGKKFVTYEVIGKNDVAVPTHFFKVITAGNGRLGKRWAYIVPNEPIDASVPLDSFLTTIEKLEHISGIVFR
jgi:endonuclease G, mitochondrial